MTCIFGRAMLCEPADIYTRNILKVSVIHPPAGEETFLSGLQHGPCPVVLSVPLKASISWLLQSLMVLFISKVGRNSDFTICAQPVPSKILPKVGAHCQNSD